MHLYGGTYDDDQLIHLGEDLNRWLSYLLITTAATFLLGILAFGEPFSLSEHAFSYLGMINTPNGNPNGPGLFIFSTGILISSYICFRLNSILHGGYSHNLFRICGIGYLVMLVPCDLFNPVHMVGAAMVFASLWFFTNIRLMHLIPFIGWLKFIFYQLILQGSVLPYAYLYAVNSPDKQFVQKIALFGLILVLKISVVEFKKAISRELEPQHH
ncbi:MAG: hypothetical protein K9J30_12475 [Bacteroidales bacterium]|nr:hypothetical protein [Bacteroidales bacterium]